jgi:hypothetical protein
VRGGDLVSNGRWWAAENLSFSLLFLSMLLFSSLSTTVLVPHLENNVIIAGRPSIVNLEQK